MTASPSRSVSPVSSGPSGPTARATPAARPLAPTRRRFLVGAGALGTAAALAACGGKKDERSSSSLKVAYQKTSAFTQLDSLLTKAKGEFEAAYPDVTIELVPI